MVSSGRRNKFTSGRLLCLLVGYQKGQVVAPSLERRLFMEMIAKGISVRAACRELGIARPGAHRWLLGATVILKDGRVKHKPPIDRIMVREISPRYLSESERIRIADLLAQGVSASQIARE